MSRRSRIRETPLTVQGFVRFAGEVLKPAMNLRPLLDRIFQKLSQIHREYRAISDQTRRLELRMQGASQQAILVLKDQIGRLQKQIEELELLQKKRK